MNIKIGGMEILSEYNNYNMNSEEKFNKAEQANQQENKTEKELSLSEIKDLVKEREGIFDSLDKFSKDEIFKKENFSDLRVAVDRPDDKFDESAYAKAGFWKKLENFINMDHLPGILKSKERGLLDKTKINEDIAYKVIEIGQNDKQERKYIEDNVIDVQGDFKKDNSERAVGKLFNVVDGEIVKYVFSGRTQKGQIEAAGKMREAEISRLETVNGKELVGLKESIEKNKQTKENMLKMTGFMSEKDKQDLTDKLNKEEADKKERIKEKEEKIADKTIFFREPLEGRLRETVEIENNLSKAFYSIKTGELDLNKKIKECESFIKEAQKLNLSDEVRADIVKNAEAKRSEMGVQIKEIAEKKILISSRLDVLKTNKKEIETTLDRVNAIGKTKEEIENAKKEKSDKKSETKTEKIEVKPIEEKKDDMFEETFTKEEMEIIKEGGRKLAKVAELILKENGKKSLTEEEIEILRDGGYSLAKVLEVIFKGKDKKKETNRKQSDTVENSKKARILDENSSIATEIKKIKEAEEQKRIDKQVAIKDKKTEEKKEVTEKFFTKEEITEIVMRELKALKVSALGGSDEEKRVRLEAMKDFPMLAKLIFTKYKGKTKEKDIKKEVQEWYKKFTKNNSKKSK